VKIERDLSDFVALLNAHNVRYLVVGGDAVVYHGSPRATGDIDFFVEVAPEDARRLEAVPIIFVNKETLRANTMSSGRAKDLRDLEALS
jgi:hypothetical protein